MKFPKIAVCPPKDTFTDLNYDLLLAENITLPLEDRQELLEFAIEVLEENNYMTNFEKIIDDNQFKNWYHGFTQLSFPKVDLQYVNGGKLEFTIQTSALSGSINTNSFGEEFDFQKVLTHHTSC